MEQNCRVVVVWKREIEGHFSLKFGGTYMSSANLRYSFNKAQRTLVTPRHRHNPLDHSIHCPWPQVCI